MTLPSPQTAAPTRIRRMRTKNWRAGPARCVDRSSRYGNPWRIVDDVVLLAPDGTTQRLTSPSEARRHASSRYRTWLHGEGPDTYRVGKRTFDRRRVHTDLGRLKNRDLACTCPLPRDGEPDHCHATVLLELANEPDRTGT